MKIIHIITDLDTGGAERSLHNLLVGGLAAHHECHVICLTKIGQFGPKIEELGVPVHSLKMLQGVPTPIDALRLGRLVRRINPDLLQGWMYHGNLAATVASLMARVKPAVVWNVRHSLYDLANERPSTRIVIRFEKLVSRHPEGIVYNSNVSRRLHEAFGFHVDRSVVIPNGFDTNVWRPDVAARERMRSTLKLGAGDKLIGFIGRYHPMKDIPSFLKTMATLMADNPKIHCVMIGHDVGPKNPNLAPFFIGIPADRLHILGRLDDVGKQMPGIDLLCLCSSWGEAFPNVVGEAMACGVPCVATDVGDCRNIIGNTGRVVAASDPVALRNALTELLQMDDSSRIALGAAARVRIGDQFSLEVTVKSYLNLYDSILEGY